MSEYIYEVQIDGFNPIKVKANTQWGAIAASKRYWTALGWDMRRERDILSVRIIMTLSLAGWVEVEA